MGDQGWWQPRLPADDNTRLRPKAARVRTNEQTRFHMHENGHPGWWTRERAIVTTGLMGTWESSCHQDSHAVRVSPPCEEQSSVLFSSGLFLAQDSQSSGR